MAIKDRDGNIFKLIGPNPVMATQHTWDSTKIFFHNMLFPMIIVPDRGKASTIDISTPEQTKVEPPHKLTKLLEDRKIHLLCLPVKIENHVDTLYGSTYSRTQFGQKRTIEGIMVSLNDLYFTFWTDATLSDKSVVYPTQTEMKRWWQVEKSEPQSGGFLVSCSPSAISPDFSD